jgi:Na+-driven multidrug efflux pump
MKIKKYFLIFAFVAVSIIALLYGVSPQWFARTFLDVPEIALDFAHILRAVMCLYLALGLFQSDRGDATGVSGACVCGTFVTAAARGGLTIALSWPR